MHQQTMDIADVAVKVAPPVAVSALHFLGVPLNEWVFILTIIYLLLQIGAFLWKIIKGRFNG